MILEIGIGSGDFLKVLKTFGYENLVGIDISSILTHRAKRINPQAQILVADVHHHPPFRSCTFDAVYCLDTIEHWAFLKLGFDEVN
jgi:SAM-dependent methyltransferase